MSSGRASATGRDARSGPELSVIVIGRNEAEHLKRCFTSIDSALAASDLKANAEIVYVDSSSDDGSLEIGKAHADRVAVLEAPLSAAAGRTVGIEESTGTFILFLDGDMELAASFLTWSLPLLRSLEPSGIGGMMGRRDDLVQDTGGGGRAGEGMSEDRNVYAVRRPRVAPHFGGAILLHRRVIDEAGGYRPDMTTNEERDLHARMRSQGWRVAELPAPFVRHHRPPKEPWLRRVRDHFRAESYSRSFGGMVVSSVRDGYAAGVGALFWPTLLVWLADLVSLGAAAGGALVVVIVLQAASFAAVTLARGGKDFLLARARMIGVLRALVGRDRARGRRDCSYRIA